MSETTKFYAGSDVEEHFDPKWVEEITLPSGYRRVYEGVLIEGDLCWNRDIKFWEEVTADDVAEAKRLSRKVIVGTQVHCFEIAFMSPIARLGTEKASVCERCECYERHGSNRFCKGCCSAVLSSKRGAR